jgi:uncharacterized protein YndB with AHSA1/START domain
MQRHSEHYEHLGDVELYVQDLDPVWQREHERRRVFVDPVGALFSNEIEFPGAPQLVWDYLTRPEFRRLHMGADGMTVGDLSAGRVSDGSVYYCAHGDTTLPQAVLDWRPFEYFTCESATPEEGVTARLTVRLSPREDGTLVTQTMSYPTGPFFRRRRVAKYLEGPFQEASRNGLASIRERLIEALRGGMIVESGGSRPTEEQMAAAIVARLNPGTAD